MSVGTVVCGTTLTLYQIEITCRYRGNSVEALRLSSVLATCAWLASCLSRVNREDRDLASGSLLTSELLRTWLSLLRRWPVTLSAQLFCLVLWQKSFSNKTALPVLKCKHLLLTICLWVCRLLSIDHQLGGVHVALEHAEKEVCSVD